MPAVMIEPRRHHRRLAKKTLRVDPGAGADPVRRRFPEARRAQRCCGRRIADPHLAEHDQIGTIGNRRRTDVDRGKTLGFGHRGRDRKVGGGPVQVDRNDRQVDPGSVAQCVDRRPAVAKIGDHLRSHRCREGADAARDDAVVACEHYRPDPVQPWPIMPLPCGEEQSDILEPPERPRGLGQGRLPRRGRGACARIGRRQ